MRICALSLALSVLLSGVCYVSVARSAGRQAKSAGEHADAKIDSLEARKGPAKRDARPGVVYVGKCHRWTLRVGGKRHQGQLGREIVRQALLIAARDQLGLTTRDAWLGDPMRTDEDNAPLELAVTAGKPSHVRILRGLPPKQAEIGSYELDPAAGLGYRNLVVEMERLSREEFVEGLKQAGLAGKSNRVRPKAAVPQEIEKLLAEMTFTSQFQAVRELHKTIRAQGESPALLGALVRGYANLGLLTEFHWYPAHKVFKARALLYAQRVLARREALAWARWHRAYALALAGLHQLALEDLYAAKKQRETAPQQAAAQPPHWVELINAHCRYDIGRLDPIKTDPACRQLAHLLVFVSLEQSNDGKGAVDRALPALRIMPECYRLIEGACQFGGVGLWHSATLAGPVTAGQRLYPRLAAMPDLPGSVRKIVSSRSSGGGILGRFLGGSEMSIEDEFKLRRKLVAALLESSRPAAHQAGPHANAAKVGPEDRPQAQSSVPDPGEPSWAALGHLIQEMSFVHVWRRARFEHSFLGVSPDEFLALAAPLVADHPYRPFIETFAWDPAARKEALRRLAKVEPEGLELTGKSLYLALGDVDRVRRDKVSVNAVTHLDAVARDLVMKCDVYVGETRLQTARELLDVSPYSPAARAHLILHDWDNVQDELAHWEKESAQHTVPLMALGHQYMERGRYADAERCLKAATGLSNSAEAHGALAELYKRQDKRDQWLAARQRYLELPSYGLGHAAVRTEIARYFISQRQWNKALPYAEAAAESYSGWSLLCAADCHEGLQGWKKAEQYTRAAAERYRGSELTWYFFCRRTGQGNLDAARRAARRYLENLDLKSSDAEPTGVAAFYLLEGKPRKALELYEQEFAKDGTPYTGLHVALLADQLNDAKKRDSTLKRIEIQAIADQQDKALQQHKTLVLLAALLADDLAKGGKGRIDLDAAQRQCSSGNAADQINYNYFLAKYLSLRGKRVEAVRHWTRCMTCLDEATTLRLSNRTLAGAELLERGVTPADYKPALQRPEPDAKQK